MTAEHVAALWRRLEEIFGAQWSSRFPNHERALAFWHSQLEARGVTPAQLAVGVQALLDSGAKYPPSLAELLHACRRRENEAMYQRNTKALEPPRTPKEEALQRLREMRKRVGV